jgi:hypothetical protein
VDEGLDDGGGQFFGGYFNVAKGVSDFNKRLLILLFKHG